MPRRIPTIYLGSLFAVCLTAGILARTYFAVFPCRSLQTAEPVSFPMTAELEALENQLREKIALFAGEIGERNLFRAANLFKAASAIRNFWTGEGFTVHAHTYEVEGIASENLWVEIPGTVTPDEIILIGAHYDTARGAPGANDNASGLAALLEISRALRIQSPPKRTLRFVAFVNEEPPFFMTKRMGSRVYAREAASRKENIVAMLSLETLGYYTDASGSQAYPPFVGMLYPDKGNFIGVVGNVSSNALVRKVAKYFRESVDFPSECIAAPRFLTGIDWSDHASFWDHGYPAIMVTDTALFRYPHYHRFSDTPDKLNYPAYAKVVYGLARAIKQLADA